MSITIDTSAYEVASFGRRLLALIYDGLLIIALLLVATLPAVAVNQGEALQHNPLYSLYLLSVLFFYYAWQWRHGGQTLAMATWKIKIISYDGSLPSWQQCFIRFISGCFGLMLFSVLFDKQRLAVHDRLSKTLCVSSNQQT